MRGITRILMLMHPLEEFIADCDLACLALGIQRATLSTKLFNDGKRLDQIAGRKSDIGVGRLFRAVRALEELRARAAE